MGEFEKHTKSLREIQRDLPKIVRNQGEKRLKETIEKQIDAEYKVKYVPVSIVEEAKKEFPLYFFMSHDGKVTAIEPTEKFIEKGKNTMDILRDWFVRWFGGEE